MNLKKKWKNWKEEYNYFRLHKGRISHWYASLHFEKKTLIKAVTKHILNVGLKNS